MPNTTYGSGSLLDPNRLMTNFTYVHGGYSCITHYLLPCCYYLCHRAHMWWDLARKNILKHFRRIVCNNKSRMRKFVVLLSFHISLRYMYLQPQNWRSTIHLYSFPLCVTLCAGTASIHLFPYVMWYHLVMTWWRWMILKKQSIISLWWRCPPFSVILSFLLYYCAMSLAI